MQSSNVHNPSCYKTYADNLSDMLHLETSKLYIEHSVSLKKGKCMVFKPRQVQDARIVKFKEI